MKLLFCTNCFDTISLILNEKRTCKCGETGGKYIDNLNAIYFGTNAVPLGFANTSFLHAIKNQPQSGHGDDFTAFVISKTCSTFKQVLKHEC